jgi:hypothetical protein
MSTEGADGRLLLIAYCHRDGGVGLVGTYLSYYRYDSWYWPCWKSHYEGTRASKRLLCFYLQRDMQGCSLVRDALMVITASSFDVVMYPKPLLACGSNVK